MLVHGDFPREVLRRAPGRWSMLTKGRGCYLSLKRLSLLTGRLSQLVLSAYQSCLPREDRRGGRHTSSVPHTLFCSVSIFFTFCLPTPSLLSFCVSMTCLPRRRGICLLTHPLGGRVHSETCREMWKHTHMCAGELKEQPQISHLHMGFYTHTHTTKLPLTHTQVRSHLCSHTPVFALSQTPSMSHPCAACPQDWGRG